MDSATADVLRVDRDSELPVGIQVAWRLRAMISSGKLGPGDRMPPVRRLAQDAGVNPNTARAIYGRLEAEGLVESRHGLGTFVAAGAASSSEVERIAADAVAEARRAGVAPADVARAIYGARWAAQDKARARSRSPTSARRRTKPPRDESCGVRSLGSKPTWPRTPSLARTRKLTRCFARRATCRTSQSFLRHATS